MNLGNMTVLNEHSQADVLSASLSVSTARGATLNPEASVFCLPSRDAKPGKSAEEQEDDVNHFMNGDVRKESCGDLCPTSDVPEQAHCPEEMSSTSNDGTDHSSSPTEKMTDGIASKMLDTPKTPSPSHEKEEESSSEEKSSLRGEEEVASSLREEGKEAVASEEGKGDEDKSQNKEDQENSQASQSEGQTSSQPLTRDQIKEVVSHRVEYFFSRENWSSDSYLQSQIDSDQYVPIYILANCSQFKNITKDHSIILDALKESVYVQLDEENNRVRPNYKRCIVILREIPKTTPVKEIEAMFEGEGCPKSLSCEFAHNDSWYVTFESDSDAQKAHRYLRETVKTFKEKPILARIKTKPMSRLGCLSVLPSYGGNNPGEVREGHVPMPGPNAASTPCMPPGNPATHGMPGVPNHHPAPNSFHPANPQRMYYPHQNNINNPYPNYNFSNSTQVPTAYFYPNPMMWTQPNFYDINAFIQYNGLSPRATYKPPTGTRFTNQVNSNNVANNRRTKLRENKYEKSDMRQSFSNVAPNNGSYVRLNQTNSRPHSAHSPHTNSGAGPVNNSNQHHSLPPRASSSPKVEGETESVATVQNNNNNSNGVQSSHTFAQNDLPTASQSTICTSFGSNGANGPRGNVKGEKTENKGETSTLKPSLTPKESSETIEELSKNGATPSSSAPSASSTTTATAAVSSTTTSSNSTLQSSVNNQPITNPLPPPSQNSSAIQHQPHHPYHHNNHHNHHHSQPMSVPHRGNFGGDSQPQRQITRGGRRRVPRRDEEMNGHHSGPGGGRGPQRGGMAGQASNADSHTRNGFHPEVTKPSFELQETSFPPLPCSDEVVAVSVPEEKVSEPAPQPAWSSDTHKFSDVMKGAAKSKQLSTTDREAGSTECLPGGPQSPGITSEGATKSFEGSSAPSSSQSGVVPEPPVPTARSQAPQAQTETSQGSRAVNAPAAGRPQERSIPPREIKPPREDRRGPGPRREFVAGIGRAGPRNRDREPVNFRLSGNKENKPQGGTGRSWREDRPDPDGWITKGPRDSRGHRDREREKDRERERENRYQNPHPRHQAHNVYENRNTGANAKTQAMVNGDSSPPPPSPQPESVNKQAETVPIVSKSFTKSDANQSKIETPVEKEKVVNNNDGEHVLSYAKVASSGKDEMEKLSSKLKEKDEQERQKRMRPTKPPPKFPERTGIREREGKPFKRDNFAPRGDRDLGDKGRDFRGAAPDRNPPLGVNAPNREVVSKSPKLN